jgi:hypothetical protein
MSGTKNKLSDLNDHLFEQIEWLTDNSVKGEELEDRIRRARAVCGLSEQIIANGNLMLAAAKAAEERPGVRKQRLLLE